jgi:PAS domain S-box-containing protein
MYFKQYQNKILKKGLNQVVLILGFGLLSIILSYLRFEIPGLTGSISDLREVAILSSIVYLPNILSIIAVSFITSFSTPPDGIFYSTFLMHAVGGSFVYIALRIFRDKLKNIFSVSIFWFFLVLIYYLVFLLPIMILTYYLENLAENLSFGLYLSVVKSAKFEIITTTLVIVLFMALKYTREGIKEKLDWLEFIIKEANLGFWSWNLKAKTLIYHKHWFKFMKFNGEPIVSQEFILNQFHPDDVVSINQIIKNTLHQPDNKEIASYEHRFYDGENKLKWFLTKGKIVVYDKEGIPLSAMGIHVDITPQKLANEEKLLSERKYREIFHAAKDIIFLLNPANFAIQDVNNALLYVLQYDTIDLLEQNFIQLSSTEDNFSVENLKTNLESALIKLPQIFEWKLATKKGKSIWVEISLSYSESLNNKYLLVIVRDKHLEKINQIELENYKLHLEELVQEKTGEVIRLNEALTKTNAELNSGNNQLVILNEEINAQKENLEATVNELRSMQMQLIQSEKLASIGTLVSGVAHEINNPLNFISGGLTALQQIREELQKGLSADSSDILSFSESAISEGLHRATKIVESLMSISVTRGSFKKMIKISQFVENNVYFFKPQLPENVILEFQIKSDISLPIYVDKMHQAFLNILDNALFELKHSASEGKKLIVSVFEKTIDNRNYLVISIYNTGKLIPEDDLNKVFEAFYTTKNPNQGKGLGLAISYAIVKEHNGFIKILNRPKGVEVCIYLPLQYFS